MKKVLALVLMLTMFIPTVFAQEANLPAPVKSFDELVLDVIRGNPQVIKETLEKYEKDLAEKQKEQEFAKLLTDRVNVEVGDSPQEGDKKADFTIVAFSDFQCPFCKRGDDTIKELQKKYDKRLRYVFKNFPLGFHPQAAPAAKAAWAAGKQGKFFEYHDKLFENQPKLGEDFYVQLAKDLGLDVDKFNKDRASDEADKEIKAEMKQGQDVGVGGTPGFILNGVKIYGAYPVEHFEKIISLLEQEKEAKK